MGLSKYLIWQVIQKRTEFTRGLTIPTIRTNHGITSRFCIYIQSNQHKTLLERQLCRSLEALSQQSKTRKKAGRPKLPKGEAMGTVIQVRFTAEDTKGIAAAAKASKQTVSEWIRSTIHANLNA